MARYLEGLCLLLPLCPELFNAFPESTGSLQAQLNMKWYGLLPQCLHEIHDPDLIQARKYDPAELTLTSSSLGLMFQFFSRRGLGDDSRNLLSILERGNTIESWPRYHNVILNALAFAVFDLDRTRTRTSMALRSRLLRPGGVRRESANMALGNRYHETTNCDNLFNDQESAVRVPLQDAAETIALVLDSEAIKLWTHEETLGEDFSIWQITKHLIRLIYLLVTLSLHRRSPPPPPAVPHPGHR